MNIEYLTDIIILLSAAVIVVPLFQSLGLGSIPGFLVAGIILGPSGMGYIQNIEEIGHFSELGVVLLLFIIGIEIKPARLWQMRGMVFGLGTLQVLITGGLISVLSHILFNLPWKISLLIGPALALSSTAFVLQLLTERKLLSSAHGKPSIAILLLQDLAVVPLLALVTLMGQPELTIAEDVFLALLEALVVLIIIILTGRYILNPLLNVLVRFGSPEIFTASALLLVLGSAELMESIGLSMAMGAFIAGLLIADSTYRHQITAEIQPFRGLLLGLFFMSMGMSLNLGWFLESPLAFIVLVIALLGLKFSILWSLTQMFGIKGKTSVAVALLLAQSGEFALVLFAIANGMELMDETLFQQLLIIVLLTMLVTPALDKLAHRLIRSSVKVAPVKDTLFNIQEQGSPPVILAGFGRVGHRIGNILEMMNIPYVAIDNNASIVEQETAKGRAVYYGDVQRSEVMRAAGVCKASLVIVTLDKFEATEHVVSILHATFPGITIFARGHDFIKCQELQRLGAQFTVSETLEASADLARTALLHIGTDVTEIDATLDRFRHKYYSRIRKNISVVLSPGKDDS